MAKLEDLEEIMYKVTNRSLLPTLEEIVKCYYASAYRACLILSFNVMVDDIVEKLKHIKDINKDAREIYEEILDKNKNSVPFEKFLIDSLYSKGIFNELDKELYDIFQKLRHKSAHPTGFSPSAECARFVFSEVINRFLSKESLKTTSRIDTLLSDIKNGNFFVGNKIGDNSKIVLEEISDLYPDTYPQLINRVYKGYSESSGGVTNPNLRFLCALAHINKPELNSPILKYIIKQNASKKNQEELFISLISSNASMFNSVDESTAERLLKQISDKCLDKDYISKMLHHSLANPFNAILQIAKSSQGCLFNAAKRNTKLLLNAPLALAYFISKVPMSNESNGKDIYLSLYKSIITDLESEKPEHIDNIISSIIDSDEDPFARMGGDKLYNILSIILKKKTNPEDRLYIIENIKEHKPKSILKIGEFISYENYLNSNIRKKTPDEIAKIIEDL